MESSSAISSGKNGSPRSSWRGHHASSPVFGCTIRTPFGRSLGRSCAASNAPTRCSSRCSHSHAISAAVASDGCPSSSGWPRLQLRRGARQFAAPRPSPPRRRNDPLKTWPARKARPKAAWPSDSAATALDLAGFADGLKDRPPPIWKMRDDPLRGRLSSQQDDSARVIEGPRTLYRAVSPHDKRRCDPPIWPALKRLLNGQDCARCRHQTLPQQSLTCRGRRA
jgi:hypothetical protein